MYSGIFSLFFSFYVSEMRDVKALISHQMFGAKEILTECGFPEKEKYWIFKVPNLVQDPARFTGFSKSILLDKPYLDTEVGGNGMYMYVCGGGRASGGG